jgi:DNA-binding NtrC family response regulator
MKFSVMIVDDSKNVFESLQWLFIDEPYYLFTFDNPHDALNVITTLDWAVAIVARSIQKMDGLEFLKKFHRDSPHTVGIIMAEQNKFTDKNDMSYSEFVFRSVNKPIVNSEIKQAVKTAIVQYETNIASKEHKSSILNNP